jgi:hypothetical protein
MLPGKTYRLADVTGIINSSICILHCIATPILISLGAYFLESPIFAYVFIAIAFVTIVRAVKRTTSNKIKKALWVGFAGLSASLLLEETWAGFEYSGYIFSALLIVTHIVNIKHCKKCNENIQEFKTI